MTFKTPKEAMESAQTFGNARVNLTMDQIFVISFMSGLYIGLGGLLALVVGGNVPGIQATDPGVQKLLFGTTFSVGLMYIVLTGSDLWTSTIMITNMNLLNPKKTRILDVLYTFKTLIVSFIANFCGALFVAFFFCYLLNKDSKEPWIAFLVKLGTKKTSTDPWFLFISAIGCNILVNTAYFMAVVSGDVSGKILGILTAIGTFVTIGFEHLVANMFFLPAAAFFGAAIPGWKLLFWNLAVVAFGNYIGGVFFFGLSFWYTHVWRAAHNTLLQDLFNGHFGKYAKGKDHYHDPQHTVDIRSNQELVERPMQTTAVEPQKAEFQV